MGEQQEIETLINEEVLLLARYLRNEKQAWIPRIADYSLLWLTSYRTNGIYQHVNQNA